MPEMDGRGSLAALHALFDGIPFPECDGCSACCHLPWLLEEERAAFPAGEAAVQVVDGVALLAREGLCPHAWGGRCDLYGRRPLDCRTFPMDIIEEQGVYWWVRFDVCPHADAISARILPLLPTLERHLAPFFPQYQAQIALMKRIYAPYFEGRYHRIRPLALPED